MKIFVGVDGGGTKTETLACDENGAVLGYGIRDASNPLFVGKDKAIRAILDSIREAAGNIEGNGGFYAAVCVPGIQVCKDELDQKLLSFCDRTTLDADELNAFLGALAKPYGVVVVSGTGSFAMGIDRKGNRKELGGWGPVLGDEGSGYFIGLSALRAVIREYEGDGPQTALTPKVKEYMGIGDIGQLRQKVYSDGFGRAGIGSLSRIVRTAAGEGDAVSLEIAGRAARELADLAERTIRKMKMCGEPYDLALTGGVRNFGPLITEPFANQIEKEFPNIRVKDPEAEPVVGSLLIALKDSGIDIMDGSIMANLKASCQEYCRNRNLWR